MGRRVSISAKLKTIRSRIAHLSNANRGCHYCQHNCYQRLSPHLRGLEQWLIQADRLKPEVLDRELLWIFQKTSAGAVSIGKEVESSEESFESVPTEASSVIKNPRSDCSTTSTVVSNCHAGRTSLYSRKRRRTCLSSASSSHVTEETVHTDSDAITVDSELSHYCGKKGNSKNNKKVPAISLSAAPC